MLRSLLSLALVLAVAASTSAQTAPRSSAGTRRATAAPSGRKAQAGTPRRAASSPSAGSTSEDGKTTDGQNVYAAPGEPVIVPSGHVGPYDGRAAGRHTTKGGTTLSPR